MSVCHCPRCGRTEVDAFYNGEQFYCRVCHITWHIVNVTTRGWPARDLEPFELKDPIQAEDNAAEPFLYRTGLEVRL